MSKTPKNDDTPPVISVLMAVYNSDAYLEDAIKSILGQTYSRFEFIIFDDGSIEEVVIN